MLECLCFKWYGRLWDGHNICVEDYENVEKVIPLGNKVCVYRENW